MRFEYGIPVPTPITRWACETCRGSLTVPANASEAGYFCCFASMTFIGVEAPRYADANGNWKTSFGDVDNG